MASNSTSGDTTPALTSPVVGPSTSADPPSSPPPAQSSSSASSSSRPLTTATTSPADPPPASGSTEASSATSDPPTSPPPASSTTTPPPASSSTTPPPDSSSTITTPPPDSSSTTPPPDSGSASSSGGTSPPPVSESGSSGSASATPPPSQTSSSSLVPSTSTQTSTVIATDANGSVFTSVVTSTLITTPTIGADSNRTSTSSSHTGAIVGGVVGGVAGAAILATLIFFICRRRRRDDFDGNFDPDRVTGDNRGTLPDIDLAAAEEVTPYNYTPPGMPVPQPAGPPAPGPGMPDMAQYGGHVPSFLAGGLADAGAGAAMAHAGHDGRTASPPSAYTQPSQSHYAPSSSDHGYPDYSAYAAYANPYPPQGGPPTSSAPSSPTNTSFGPQTGVAGRDFRHPSPGPSLAATTLTDPSTSGASSNNPGVIPSAKEREAMQYRRQVANPDGATAGGPSGVLQHQDGGRLNATPEDEEPSEVPPRYDSIRHD